MAIVTEANCDVGCVVMNKVVVARGTDVKVIRKNLAVRLGDLVTVKAVDNLPNGTKVSAFLITER